MAQVIQRSFTSGEIAPSVRSRADLTKYTTGLALCQNMIVRAQGGVYSRPGMRHVGQVFDSSRRARLIPFSFNTDQTYALVFEHLRMSVVKDGGFVLESTKAITGVALTNPVQVTVVGHGYATGDPVFISGLAGTIELNDQTFTITSTGANTFTLDGVDGTALTAYTSGGTAARVYSISTPYTESQLPFLQFTQSADVMTLVHRDHADRDLQRLADDNWSLVVRTYTGNSNIPQWLDQTVKNLGSGPAINSISNEAQAVVNYVGAHNHVLGEWIHMQGVNYPTEVFRSFEVVDIIDANNIRLDWDTTNLPGVDASLTTVLPPLANAAVGVGGGQYNVSSGSDDKLYGYVITSVDEDGNESLPSEPRVAEADALSSIHGIILSWTPIDDVQYYRVYKDISGNTGIYGWIGDVDGDRHNFVDFNIAPVSSDAPPVENVPFDAVNNYPAAVTYFQQRQIFANTYNDPQTIFATRTADYRSFRYSRPTRDDDSIEFTLASRQVNEIRHLVPLDSLVILTSGAEFRLTEGQDQVLTPATIGVRPQSFNGSSWVRPVVINSTALYVQEKGTRLRDLLYDFSSDSYTGSDLSIMSEHLLEDHEIEEMSFAQEPYGVVWLVRDDGVLLGFTYQREHQVWGWHQHLTDGEFESVASISENGRDATYVIVKRTINGVTKRYVERMEPRFVSAAEDTFCVDSGSTYSGAAATTIYGLWYLEGKQVAVLADGNVVPNLTVQNGQITIPNASSKVHIGLAYTPAIETLDIDLTSVKESLKARRVNISQVVVEVEKSRGLWVGPIADDGAVQSMREVKPRYDSDGYGSIALRDFKEIINIEPDWTRGGRLRFEQRSPLPLAILSVTPDVDTGD